MKNPLLSVVKRFGNLIHYLHVCIVPFKKSDVRPTLYYKQDRIYFYLLILKKNNSKYYYTHRRICIRYILKMYTIILLFTAKATKPKEFLVLPKKVEENQSITIHCIADVGSPHGYIEILKETDKSIVAEVIYKSTKTDRKTENCTDLINVTTTYNITRGDNGALFRCSSKNNFTKDPIPSSDSSKISVLCM